MSGGNSCSFRWRAISTSCRRGPNGHNTATRSVVIKQRQDGRTLPWQSYELLPRDDRPIRTAWYYYGKSSLRLSLTYRGFVVTLVGILRK